MKKEGLVLTPPPTPPKEGSRLVQKPINNTNFESYVGSSPPLEGLGGVFFENDALWVAENLLGKKLVRRFDDGRVEKYVITETEAYFGEEDLACHAAKGRTPRTEVMYHAGGKIYVYFIYGMYWLLNFVTGTENHPQAVLIRGLEGINGPGRVGKILQLDKSFYGETSYLSERLWIEDAPKVTEFQTAPRIGVGYAGEVWANKPWRFFY